MDLADSNPRFHKVPASLHLCSPPDHNSQKEALGLCFLKRLAAGICFSCSKRSFVSRFSKESLGSQYCGLPRSLLMGGNDEGIYVVWVESMRVVGRSIFLTG